MQLNERTLTILKNFNSINSSILINPGNIITTMALDKTMLATAEIAESFDKQFGIFDLSKFLGVLSLFENPDIIINEKYATISSGRRNVTYVFADTETIPAPKSNKIDLKEVFVAFDMSLGMLKDIKKASAVMSLPEIAIFAEDNELSIKAFDSQNPTGDTYNIKISDGDYDSNFSFIFKTDKLKMIDQDYRVYVDRMGICKFEAPDISYWLTVEYNSKK